MQSPSQSSRKTSSLLVKRTNGFPSASRTIALVPPNTNDPAGYYDTLGINPAASPQEIKTAYRMWARIYHPDGEEPDEEMFRYVAHIYRILSNPDKRREYDECVGPYISDWEMQQALQDSSDLIQGLRMEEDEEVPKEQPQESSQAVSRGYSFWCAGGEEYDELAQEWYPYFLAAAGVFKLDMLIQIGVGRINRPFWMQILPSKRIVWWVDPKTPPNFFTAYLAVSSYFYD